MKNSRRCVLCYVGIAFCLLAGTGRGLGAETPASRLAVIARDGVTLTGAATARRDFGAVDPSVTPRLEAVFTLRNAGTAPVAMDRLQPSCGCTSAFLEGASPTGARTLAPGAQADVQVSVDLATFFQGDVTRSVFVFAGGAPQPVLTLEMTAHVAVKDGGVGPGAGVGIASVGEGIGPVAATPSALIFGSVPAGHPATRAVLLSAPTEGDLKGVKVASGSPWLSAKVRASQPASRPATAGVSGSRRAARATLILEVTLSPRTPRGGLETELTMTTGAGERLALPVLANVTGGPR